MTTHACAEPFLRSMPRLAKWTGRITWYKLVPWVATLCRWTLTIVKQTGTGFQVLPKRWIVERTFAWLLRFRRLSKDYEFLTETSEAMIQSLPSQATGARVSPAATSRWLTRP